MASSPKLLPLFLLLTTIIFSPQTHARDSQFFSKVTRNHDPDTTTTTTTTTTNSFYDPNANPNNVFKQNDEFSTLTKQEEKEEEPLFIPQTSGTGYRLYGHETGLDSPSTTTTTTPLYNLDEKKNSYYNNNNNNEKNYATELKGLSEFNNNYYDNNNNNNYYNRNHKKYGDEGKGYYGEGARYNGGVEKQGMSDTRFLENGKYYYNVDAQKKNDYGASYMTNTNHYNSHYNNGYKNNGYYGNGENKNEEFYNKNNYGNSMQGYQNQMPEEEEFDFDP